MLKCGWRIDPRRRWSPLQSLFVFLLMPLMDWRLTMARKLPDIQWHSNNSIFDISNTEHVKRIHLLDRITLLCPPPIADDEAQQEQHYSHYEYSKLFMVSRDAYEQCALRGGERQLGVCATPERQSSITLVFRELSPLPSAFTFRPGHSYFVITTSNGTLQGLNNTQGGLCTTRNMRLKFDILPTSESEEETADQEQQENAAHSPSSHSHSHHHAHHQHHGQKQQRHPSTGHPEDSSEVPPFLYVIHTVDTPYGEDDDDDGEGREEEEVTGAEAWSERRHHHQQRHQHGQRGNANEEANGSTASTSFSHISWCSIMLLLCAFGPSLLQWLFLLPSAIVVVAPPQPKEQQAFPPNFGYWR